MDIWRWVVEAEARLEKEGQPRLAELMRLLPHLTCEDRHAEVDALVPEAVALARAERDPWIEVFLRHWHLQSRVLRRHEVTDSLPEAVSLLELAHRENVRGCPQSVCCTQDLAACYADLDGPGYVEERLAVSAETLSRIDPSWPCFDCISAEHASALADAGRHADRLAFLDQQMDALSEAGQRAGLNLRRQRCEALIDLGRPAEALEHARKLDRGASGRHGELDNRSLLARALALGGEPAEGARTLPEPAAILNAPALGMRWTEAARALVERGAIRNDWRLGRTLRLLHDKLRANGSLYNTAWVATHAAELATMRGATAIAELAIRDAQEMLPKLRKPELLRPRIEALAAVTREPVASVAVEELRRRLEETGDPEPILGALAGRADDEQLVALEGEALERAGAGEEAVRRLQSFLRVNKHSQRVARILADLWLERGAIDELGKACIEYRADASPAAAYFGWRWGDALREAGRREEAERVLEEVTRGPAPLGAFVLFARVVRERGDVASAMEKLDRLIENAPAGDADWERMICASLLGRWSAVRQSAVRLGMDFGEGDERIEVPGPLCRLRVQDRNRQRVVYAVRIGPVTARVLELTGADGELERFDDVVVFDPRPDNPDARADDPGRPPVFVYPAIQTLIAGEHRSYPIEGLHPGQSAIDEARRVLGERKLELQVLSSARYAIDVDGVQKPAVFLLVAAHRSVPALQIEQALRDRFGQTELTWLELARDAGVELERHRAIAQRLRLPVPKD